MPRQPEVPTSTETIHLEDRLFLPRLEMRNSKKRCQESQPEFCREKLSVENRHLLGSWSLAFRKPQLAFPVTLVPKVVCHWRNTYSAGRLTRV